MRSKLSLIWRENRRLLLFVFLLFIFRGAIADWNNVPTGSMKPSIVEGDVILVNKLAYDLKFPFSSKTLYSIDHPHRGDVVVFDSERAEKKLVKRVIGLPGDQVAMVDNRLIINGEPLAYETGDDGLAVERLEGNDHALRLSGRVNPRMANFGPVTVPSGHYLVLGDNRNNSADSRVYGFVPEAEIVGRAERVLVSLNPDNYYLPRSSRLLAPMLSK